MLQLSLHQIVIDFDQPSIMFAGLHNGKPIGLVARGMPNSGTVRIEHHQ